MEEYGDSVSDVRSFIHHTYAHMGAIHKIEEVV